MSLIRTTLYITATHNIRIHVSHIPGVDNVLALCLAHRSQNFGDYALQLSLRQTPCASTNPRLVARAEELMQAGLAATTRALYQTGARKYEDFTKREGL